MCNIDYLTLVSGVDIPIPKKGLVMRQPKLREIAMLGEEEFYSKASFLLITKEKMIENLSKKFDIEEVESVYGNFNEYQILQIILGSEPKTVLDVQQILILLFPEYNVSIEENGLMFIDKDGIKIIYPDDYEEFREYIKTILCLNNKATSEDEYNPADEAAKEIARKLKKRKERLSELNPKEHQSVLGNYLSSIAIGTNSYTIEAALDLTIFQLFDQISRYTKWHRSEFNIDCTLAGAKDVESINWFENLE